MTVLSVRVARCHHTGCTSHRARCKVLCFFVTTARCYHQGFCPRGSLDLYGFLEHYGPLAQFGFLTASGSLGPAGLLVDAGSLTATGFLFYDGSLRYLGFLLSRLAVAPWVTRRVGRRAAEFVTQRPLLSSRCVTGGLVGLARPLVHLRLPVSAMVTVLPAKSHLGVGIGDGQTFELSPLEPERHEELLHHVPLGGEVSMRVAPAPWRRARLASAVRAGDGLGLARVDDDEGHQLVELVVVVLGQREHSLLEITRALLTENAKGAQAKYDALADYGLDGFYWQGVARIYGYESSAPSIDDLVLWIFQRAIEGFKSGRPGGLQNIQLDFASLNA